jgi:hypothetical protein
MMHTKIIELKTEVEAKHALLESLIREKQKVDHERDREVMSADCNGSFDKHEESDTDDEEKCCLGRVSCMPMKTILEQHTVDEKYIEDGFGDKIASTLHECFGTAGFGPFAMSDSIDIAPMLRYSGVGPLRSAIAPMMRSDIAPMLRNSGVGPLLIRTGSSSSDNELAMMPRAERFQTMPRHECAKLLITKQGSFTRTPSAGCKTNMRPQKTFTRVPSIATVPSFSRDSPTITEQTSKPECSCIDQTFAFERVSSVTSARQKRRPSDTTDALNMPSMIHRASSTEMFADFQALKVQGSQTLDPRLFDPHSPQFLFQDIEI